VLTSASLLELKGAAMLAEAGKNAILNQRRPATAASRASMRYIHRTGHYLEQEFDDAFC
jgi:hypothetical protein